MNKLNIKSVLFDLDGTIVDTEKYYNNIWPDAFKKYGYNISSEDALGLRSLGQPFLDDYLKKLFGKVIDVTDIKNYARSKLDESVNTYGLELKEGVIDCLQFLKLNDIKSVVVTATSYERSKMYIKKAKLEGFFDNIISAKEVPNGKPAPDVYLKACNVLNVDPVETLAVEDSPNGALSAIRAKCNVVMVPDLTEPDEELKKSLYAVIPSLKALPSLFAVK